MENARTLAVRLLLRTFGEGSYSNIALDQALSRAEMSAADKRLCAQLYYGVTERLLTLEYALGCYSSRPPEKLDAPVRFILYLGLYQMLYCGKIPERAAVDESVKLTAAFRKKSAAGFVNAVLRGFLRAGKQIPEPEDVWLARQVRFSVPQELLRTVYAEHGAAAAERFFADSLRTPPTVVRLNPLRAQPQDLAALHPVPCEGIPDAYAVDAADIAHTEAFLNGWFHVQDPAPQRCCQLLGAQPGETVLDVCAAPGGKTFTIAEMMQDTGTVYAFDLHPNRVKLIRSGAERLGLTCIRADVQDAKLHRIGLPQADRVLCDVPCSGFGVIRRKPEIRYKTLGGFAALPQTQYEILSNAASYLRPGGTLVYATCTILRAENEAVTERFLQNHPAFVPEPLHELGEETYCRTFIEDGSDGFFVARMRRQ